MADLIPRARARAVILRHDSVMGAIAAHFGTEDTRDGRVRALYAVLKNGHPNYDKLIELCEVFKLDLADAGFWFTRFENRWRELVIKAPALAEGDEIL